MTMTDKPLWWSWEIEITPHIEKRMVQRYFNEIDLRTMLHSATNFEKDIEEGRFKIMSSLRNSAWEIIVEPDYQEKVLVLVTAYSIEG
jgi:hypothetical protein